MHFIWKWSLGFGRGRFPRGIRRTRLYYEIVRSEFSSVNGRWIVDTASSDNSDSFSNYSVQNIGVIH